MDIFNMINWNALSALATAASAIVTAIMVWYTRKTLRLSEKQLEQLKRQWNEEHRPLLVFNTEYKNGMLFLCVENKGTVQVKNIRIIVAEDFIQKLRKNKSFFIHEDLKLISEGSCHVFNYLQPFGRLKICISDVHGWNIIHILSDSLIKIKCSYNDYEEETELLVKQTIRL